MDNKYKVLILGQIPPPYHGQSLMIKALLDSKMNYIEKYFVRMNYSSSIADVGKFEINKLIILIKVILSSIWKILYYKIDLVYYPPAGANHKVAVIRDMITLIFIRRFCKKIVFHFHAKGLDAIISKFNKFFQKVIYYAYNKPTANIYLSEENKKSLSFTEPDYEFIIPYGIEDYYPRYKDIIKSNKKATILYVGNLIESKGIFILLAALEYLKKEQLKFKLQIIGGIGNEKVKQKIYEHPEFNSNEVEYLGVITGDEKWKIYASADIFCFPTYYQSENFPVVILEAMQFALPVVSTFWCSIPSMVVDNNSGFLVPPEDPVSLAEKLSILIAKKGLRNSMGLNGRELFLKKYSNECYRDNFEDMFLTVAKLN